MPIQKKRAGKNPLYKRVNQNVVSRCYINYMIILLYCQEKRRNTNRNFSSTANMLYFLFVLTLYCFLHILIFWRWIDNEQNKSHGINIG